MIKTKLLSWKIQQFPHVFQIQNNFVQLVNLSNKKTNRKYINQKTINWQLKTNIDVIKMKMLK